MNLSKRVLVIDDSEDICEAVCDLLKEVEIDAIAANGGRQGIEIYQQDPQGIDAILLDMRMPGMDGTQTLRELRKLNRTLPVILSSGDGEANRFSDDPAVFFLYKPYSFDALIDKVQQVLGPASAGSSAERNSIG